MSTILPEKPKKRAFEFKEEYETATPELEVPRKTRIKDSRMFVDNLREIEDLEIRIAELREENKKLQEAYPDLAAFEGIQDKWYRKKMYSCKTNQGRKRLFGASAEKANETYKKSRELEAKNREKNPKKQKAS